MCTPGTWDQLGELEGLSFRIVARASNPAKVAQRTVNPNGEVSNCEGTWSAWMRSPMKMSVSRIVNTIVSSYIVTV